MEQREQERRDKERREQERREMEQREQERREMEQREQERRDKELEESKERARQEEAREKERAKKFAPKWAIDRIDVPPPEISVQKTVHVAPREWPGKIEGLVTASAKALKKVEGAVPDTWVEVVRDTSENVVGDLKEKILDHIPGAGTLQSLEDRYKMLKEGYADKVIGLWNDTFADVQRTVAISGTTSTGGSFVEEQPASAERRAEVFRASELKLAGKSFVEGLKNAWERDVAAAEAAAEAKPVVVRIEPTPHPDTSRWRSRNEK